MQKNVLNYLYRIVKEKPDKTAFSDGAESLTFRQVYQHSQSVGSCLAQRGIYKKPVAVFMRKSPREIAAFFGVIAGGCFYVPLDEEMPSSRIQLILDNVHAPLVICDEATLEIARSFDLKGGEAILFEEAAGTEIDSEALEDIHRRAIDIDPIYIVFTSDSLDIVSLIAEISDEFDVVISAKDMIPENFNSVEALYTLIQRLEEDD